MHWTLKKAIGAAIVVMVGAFATGLWIIIRNTLKIPDLERASTEQHQDIAYLKTTMLTLMQKTGHPPTQEDLQKLISSVGDFGTTTAKLVSTATVTVSGEPPSYFAWVPSNSRITLSDVRFDSPTHDQKVISSIIANTMVSGDSGAWAFDGQALRGTFAFGSVVLTPQQSFRRVDLGSWASEANALRAELRSVPTPRPESPPPRPR